MLDPRGLMPNPKVGTVTMSVEGAVDPGAEKAGIVHAGIGKVSFDEGKFVEDIEAFAVTSPTGPGVKGEPGSVLNA